jgi:hypothetical protein
VVEQLASNGADLIKVYENVSREAYCALIDEARRRKIPVDGHLPFRITPEGAAAGQRTVGIPRPSQPVAPPRPTLNGNVSREFSPATRARREARNSC